MWKRLIPYLFLLLAVACSQTGNEQTSRPSWDTTPDPEAVIDRLDNTQTPSMPGDRQSWQNPDLVLEKLGNLTNKVVADVGAGTGYFTFRLADLGAKVIAIDIDPDFLSYIDDRREQLTSSQQEQISTRLSRPDDPLLELNEADIVLLVNTYSFLPERINYLRLLNKGLAANGMICIVDYKDANVPVISDETPIVQAGTVRQELMEAGFSNINVDNSSLEFQYIITAKK